MSQLKGVISKESGQDAWCERINLLSQAVSVIGEDYVKQLNDGGIVDNKIEASQLNQQSRPIEVEPLTSNQQSERHSRTNKNETTKPNHQGPLKNTKTTPSHQQRGTKKVEPQCRTNNDEPLNSNHRNEQVQPTRQHQQSGTQQSYFDSVS